MHLSEFVPVFCELVSAIINQAIQNIQVSTWVEIYILVEKNTLWCNIHVGRILIRLGYLNPFIDMNRKLFLPSSTGRKYSHEILQFIFSHITSASLNSVKHP